VLNSPIFKIAKFSKFVVENRRERKENHDSPHGCPLTEGTVYSKEEGLTIKYSVLVGKHSIYSYQNTYIA